MKPLDTGMTASMATDGSGPANATGLRKNIGKNLRSGCEKLLPVLPSSEFLVCILYQINREYQESSQTCFATYLFFGHMPQKR
jgi:hypothetical protein